MGGGSDASRSARLVFGLISSQAAAKPDETQGETADFEEDLPPNALKSTVFLHVWQEHGA